jgi:hypothetical protein
MDGYRYSWLILFLLSSCMASKPSNAIDALAEEVIKKREGVDIRVTPIEETKNK